MDGAIRRAQRAGKSGSLTLAVRPGAGQRVLTGLLNSYAELRRSGPVEVLYCYDEVSALHAGAADVALMCATSTTNGLELLVLGDERPVAALPAGHRLTARPSLAMADLRSLPEFSDALPNEPLDAIVDRVARGLLVVVVGEGVADRLGAAVADRPRRRLPDHPPRAGLARRPGPRPTCRAGADGRGTRPAGPPRTCRPRGRCLKRRAGRITPPSTSNCRGCQRAVLVSPGWLGSRRSPDLPLTNSR